MMETNILNTYFKEERLILAHVLSPWLAGPRQQEHERRGRQRKISFSHGGQEAERERKDSGKQILSSNS